MMGVQTIRAILEAISNGDHGFTSLVWWGKIRGVCVCKGWGTLGEKGGLKEEAQIVSEDDTHNEEYGGCVILIIPLTPPSNLILFDSSRQAWWKSVCMHVCVCVCVFVSRHLSLTVFVASC